jgi:hypothetical protein
MLDIFIIKSDFDNYIYKPGIFGRRGNTVVVYGYRLGCLLQNSTIQTFPFTT